MGEFRPPNEPLLSPERLRQAQSIFNREVSQYLSLTPEENAALGDLPAPIWVAWAGAVMGGGECATLMDMGPAGTMDPHLLTDMALMGGIQESGGRLHFHYTEGIIAAKVQNLYEQNSSAARNRFDNFSRRLAHFVFTTGSAIGFDTSAWTNFVPRQPQTFFAGNPDGSVSVRFSHLQDFGFPIEGSAETVVNLGPGMSGGEFAVPLIDRAKDIYFVSGGMGAEFVNQWLEVYIVAMDAGIKLARQQNRLNDMLPTGANSATATMPTPHFYRDGIAKSMDRLTKKYSKRGHADIVMMSSVHSAGVAENVAGIKGAATILRPGGYLIVKAPTISIDDEAGMDKMSPIATSHFGEPLSAGLCGENKQGKVPYPRSASFAIYQKR